ncbi:adventurous gliding motility protein CglF [Hyalangium rubrum]|uniref:Adventurous gliding motility protein CglF n=1 Tax=Hyalangium rubrum TaxID=3103134 RepID=A0ABU5H994_9BACT|nr:adventurous gliding motility protein CglF [Hyalangium sp. s54d21]MDY7229816.1 adventurous gliding motility protein CglF [Hyalangium sp. s54d21]
MRKLLTVCMVLAVAPAFAQDEGGKGGGEGNVRYSKTTTIDFEDDTIEGDLTKPDGEYVEARKKVKHSNLIRIREDFEDKVMQSVGEL